jgi:hypothetical protein
MVEVLKPCQVMSGNSVDPMLDPAGSATTMELTRFFGSISMLTLGMFGSESSGADTFPGSVGDSSTQLPGCSQE